MPTVGLSHDAGLHIYHRSRTMSTFGEVVSKKNPALMEMEKRARREVERAIKVRYFMDPPFSDPGTPRRYVLCIISAILCDVNHSTDTTDKALNREGGK